MKKNLFGIPLDKLTAEFVSLGQSKYRGKQLYTWIYEKGVYDFDQMTDIFCSVLPAPASQLFGK